MIKFVIKKVLKKAVKTILWVCRKTLRLTLYFLIRISMLIEKKDSSQFLDELNEEFRIKNPKIANAFNKSKAAATYKAYSLKEEYDTIQRSKILATK